MIGGLNDSKHHRINYFSLVFCKSFYSGPTAGTDAPKFHNPSIHKLRHFDISNPTGCCKIFFPLIAFCFLMIFFRWKSLTKTLQSHLIQNLDT